MDGELVYHPHILGGMTEICAHFKVGRETVMEWLDMGAPIAVEYQGKSARYSCEAAALQKWRLEKCRKKRQPR